MKSGKSETAKDVENYLRRVPTEARASLEKLRQTIKSVAPEADRSDQLRNSDFQVEWAHAGFVCGFFEHCSFFPGAGPVDEYQDELRSFKTSKGTIRFTQSQPLSASLVKKLVKTRIRLNEELMKKRAAKEARQAEGRWSLT